MPKYVKKRRKDKKERKIYTERGREQGKKARGEWVPGGPNRKLGHEEKRNKKERSGKVSFIWSFPLSLPFNTHLLWTSPLKLHNEILFLNHHCATNFHRRHNITGCDIWMVKSRETRTFFTKRTEICSHHSQQEEANLLSPLVLTGVTHFVFQHKTRDII